MKSAETEKGSEGRVCLVVIASRKKERENWIHWQVKTCKSSSSSSVDVGSSRSDMTWETHAALYNKTIGYWNRTKKKKKNQDAQEKKKERKEEGKEKRPSSECVCKENRGGKQWRFNGKEIYSRRWRRRLEKRSKIKKSLLKRWSHSSPQRANVNATHISTVSRETQGEGRHKLYL